ncbi:hypothetical protein HCN44_010317 [Aphidius gifuensis]|uniref:MULE transposase domain-containing protein n=1 Tax=Aphidius gifuensis TaxID=684658 RepID=A0A835CRW2_APHGI|nr:hypothetical protein HCN44_010317 [Aphidius gifuensis]
MSERWREKYTQKGPVNLTIRSAQGTDESEIIIYTDVRFTQSLPPLTKWGIDATFKVCPKKPKMRQFLTIMALVDDVLPFAWAIMTKKSTAAYRALFNELIDIYNNALQPNEILMDFEAALRAACLEFFPNVVITHCHFHHSQAVVEKLGSAKGKKRVNDCLKAWPRGRLFFRKLLSLILLPAHLISDAFYHLVDSADEDIIIYFRNILTYYERQWLQRVTPPVYSLYNVRHRTNNPLESYHHLLRAFWIGYQRNIWLNNNLIDWNELLLGQVGLLANKYWEWVNLPVKRSIRLFKSDVLK